MFFRKFAVYSLLAAMTVAAAPLASARAGGPKDILEIIPQDAWGFAMARSLDTVDAKAKLLKEALTLPMIPDKVSPMALAMFELGDAVDTSSPICAVMLDAQKFGGEPSSPQNAAVLLVPAREPKALLEKLKAEEALDGVSKCTVKGEPAYAAVRNKIVILGPGKDSVTHLAKTKKTLGDDFAKARAAVIDDSDIYLSISVQLVVNAYKDMFMPMAQMMMAAQDPEGKTVKQLVKLFSEIAAFDISIGVDPKGFSLRMLVCPVKDSDLQKLAADEKNTTDALLAMLPKEKFLFSFGGLATQSEHKDKFSDPKGISNAIKMMSPPGIDVAAIESIEKDLIELQKSIRQYALSISALPEGSDGLFGAAIVAEVGDSKAFVEGVRGLYTKVWKASEDEDFVALKKSIVHAADGETIDGKKVDTITINVAELAERGEASKDDVDKAQKIIGKECVVRFGAVDDKHIAIVYGGGEKRYGTVCGAVKSEGDSLAGDKGIVDLSGQLPSPRSGECFIAVDSILQTFKAGAKLVGEEEEFPIDAPTLNAPVAMATSVQDKSVTRFDFVVPMKLVVAAKEAMEKYSASAKDEDFDEEGDDAAAGEEEGGEEKPAAEPEGDEE
ncbi:MAG TPA: hypothetical protein VJZ71_15950 [Phycisphaerae bacterium]|nr:hypothetical protein [Phycisphaerae bacterium]